jgi:ABC-type multidrug transport system fused ATPase/permease subunit
MLVQAFTIVFVGINRIRDFLLLPEMPPTQIKAPDDPKYILTIKDGVYKWADPRKDEFLTQQEREEKAKKDEILLGMEAGRPTAVKNTPSKTKDGFAPLIPLINLKVNQPTPSVATLTNINVNLVRGSLTMVIGGCGSGKSSLANALLGEIPMIDGEVRRAGTVSYCPQIAWINRCGFY